MNYRFLLSALLSFLFITSYSQTCLQNGIQFSSQSDVDSFPMKYVGCDSILGEVSISGDDITNLDGLIQLTYIGGSLLIQENNNLKDIIGLGGVKIINGSLSIASNDSLKTLTGLNNVKTINGDFAIKGNDELDTLSQIVFDLDSIKGILQISQNLKLSDLSSFIGVTYVHTLEISNNRALVNLIGLESLSKLEGHLDIGNNNGLISVSGLENLDSIGSYLSIYGNRVLENLDGLVSLKKIGSNFNLFFNAALTNIIGLSSLNNLNGLISISGNNNLQSLEGLDSLDVDNITYVEIFFNRELEVCNTPSICEYLSECGEANIYKNLGTCEYLSDVQLACGLDSTSYEVTDSGCDSVVFKGTSYFDSGIFIHTIPSTTGGCDTSVILFLTIPKSNYSEIKAAACDSFIFGLDTLYESGQYTYFGKNNSGCDSTVILNFTIYTPSIDTLDITSCIAANVNGFIYTESGSYIQDHLVNAGGCDSTLIVNVTITDGSPDNDTVYIQACDVLILDSTTILSDTSWVEYFVNAQLCDSVVTTIVDISTSTFSAIEIIECGFYVLNGVDYDSSGIYQQVLTNEAGCDSIITLGLTLLDGNHSFTNITTSACESFIFAGDTLKATGIYVDSLINKFGCDSIITLNLTILEDKVESIFITTCESAIVNNFIYTLTGTYFQNLLTDEGCDSFLIVNIIINPGINSSGSITEIACDEININGISYDESGVYVQKLVNEAGCDSTLTINLTVYESFDTIINAKACEEYTLNGQRYIESGIYKQFLQTTNGCDSNYILNLIIGYETDTTFSATACDAYVINNQNYTESGIYTQLLFNSVGCDSTITLNLTILDSSNMLTIFDVESCGPYTFNGITYDVDGRYVQKFINSVGCDSSVQVNLTILESTSDTIISSACNAFTINDSIYTATGSYTQNLTNAQGCDSFLVLLLTIYNSGTLEINETTCDSFVFNDFIYFQSGTYTQFIADENGCDSIITINLDVLEVNTEISIEGDTLYASSDDELEYQWIDCRTGELIVGATSFSYFPPVNGEYASLVSNGSCKDTTDCISFISSTRDENKFTSVFISPNPNTGNFNIILDENIKDYTIKIFDQVGKEVRIDFERHLNTISVSSSLIPGVYTVRLEQADKQVNKRMIVVR